jgi:indolepyruvate ferredoxin oxidoreductase beta subunit
VVTHVRISDKEVHSPLIEEGGADVIVAFELLEGYRWLAYLKPGGTLLVNNRRINPMPVIIGSAEYPAHIPETMDKTVGRATFVDADRLAREAGSIKAANTVLMGALSKSLPFGEDQWLAVIEKSVKPAFVDINKKAFLLGREEIQ